MATSLTVVPIGPGVSCVCDIGTINLRDNKPTVGFSPTIPFIEEGQIIEPSVSVPTATEIKFAATAAALPELDPQAEYSNE